MKFSFENLKRSENSGERLGGWKGLSVFSSCRNKLAGKGSGAYFIVYDDNNHIVKKTSNTWYCYGKVSADGQVVEWDKRPYMVMEVVQEWNNAYHYDTQTYEPKTHAVCGRTEEECDGTAAVAASDVVGDVKLEIDIDKVLANARTLTVESLLEGFNYGLDAKG